MRIGEVEQHRAFMGTIMPLGDGTYGLRGRDYATLRNEIGQLSAADEGKRVYRVGDLLELETDEERDQRLKRNS